VISSHLAMVFGEFPRSRAPHRWGGLAGRDWAEIFFPPSGGLAGLLAMRFTSGATTRKPRGLPGAGGSMVALRASKIGWAAIGVDQLTLADLLRHGGHCWT